MNKTAAILSAVIIAVTSGGSLAADQQQDRNQSTTRVQTQEQDRTFIYGSQLMTPEERADYRSRMRSARTWEEREAIRLEHHQRMQERARIQGLTLPDEPPAPGRGYGPGSGMGPGMGPGAGGGGMGPGGRR